MRILIIGAGLGGLTLLHGLRAAGMDAEVFERSARDGQQPASYGIHLNADGLRALHSCLPSANWAAIDRAGIPAPNIIRFRDPAGQVLATLDKRFPEHDSDLVTRRRAISRGRLREALLLGAENHVRWGKRFASFEPAGTGVRVRFDDGICAEGDVLVGADGSNSRVRHQLLPGLDRQELGIINIAGRIPLGRDLAHALPENLIDGGINNVVPAGAGWMFLSTWDTGDPDISDVSAGADKYIVWAWAGAASSYPDDVEKLAGAELKHLVLERIRTWSPSLRQIVNRTDPATVGTVPLRTMPELPSWTPSRVTLLGDAIHNMTPMAGIGANTALRDADQLREALTQDHASISEAIGAYENAMREYANQALALSTRNARNAALASGRSRTVFRRLLRVGAHLPPLKRAMFGLTRH
jgi:2-polyprenyl-6-methoxyphenol hydroxylase-like FAD-dependent oxidoreductase